MNGNFKKIQSIQKSWIIKREIDQNNFKFGFGIMEKINFKDLISQIPPSLSIDGLIEQFKVAKIKMTQFFLNLDEDTFFLKPKEGWSPLENINHLQSSTSPVTIFLRKEFRIMLFLFGRGSSRKSTEEIIEIYKSRLSTGSGAGIFTPFGILHFSIPGKKQFEINQLESSIESIIQSLPSWKEEELDDTCIPHPILGIIPMREMLYFTLYHIYHHSSKIQERLGLYPDL